MIARISFGLLLIFVLGTPISFAQTDSVYTQRYLDKSTKFAWLTYGADLNILTGGTTGTFNTGMIEPSAIGSTFMPRLTIGGIHFWGHADLYVTFPLSFLTYQRTPVELEELDIYQGVETGLRLYPLALAPQTLRPFAGISFRRIRYAQLSEGQSFPNGPVNYGTIVYPLQFGLTYTTEKWHITASGYYITQNKFDYFLSPSHTTNVMLDPFSFNISVLRYLDSDRSFREKGAADALNQRYRVLARENLLNAWFFGVGPSAALQISRSPFLKSDFPFFHDTYSASILPDLTFGRYFYETDVNLNISYRTYGDTYRGFDSEIGIRRHSAGIESVKYLFNWLGFAPFAGPVVSYEHLRTTINGQLLTENKIAAGITFGWDIRVTDTGTSVLRTNLRWYPDLHMRINGEKMMFNHLEFNFIQWVQYIGRKKALK